MSAPNYEQFTNGPQTTLNGAINNSVTTLVVTSATGFPTKPNFRILIDTEIMVVTAVAGTTYTVTRGAESTTAASHSNLANVTHILTAGALGAQRADALLRDTFANRPTAGVLGRLFIPSSSDHIDYDDGTIFRHLGPLNEWTQPPLASGFTQGNMTANPGTATDDSGTIYFTSNPISGWNICDQYIAKPSTPYTIIANLCLDAFNNTGSVGNLAGCGIHIRDSSSGKIVTNTAWFESATPLAQFSVTEFSGFQAVTADELAIAQQAISLQNIWMKFTDNGTNRIVYLSNDGRNWTQMFSISNNTYVPSTYNQVGWFVATNSSAHWIGTPAAKLRSWVS